MKIGRYKHRLTIQEPRSEAQNSFGEPEITWVDINTIWCSVEPVSGREYLAAKEVQSEVSVRVRMRYRPGMNAKMRFYGGSKYYEITNVQNFEYGPRKKETVCMCREIST